MTIYDHLEMQRKYNDEHLSTDANGDEKNVSAEGEVIALLMETLSEIQLLCEDGQCADAWAEADAALMAARAKLAAR